LGLEFKNIQIGENLIGGNVMTTINKSFNWTEFQKIGIIEKDLNIKLEKLKDNLIKQLIAYMQNAQINKTDITTESKDDPSHFYSSSNPNSSKSSNYINVLKKNIETQLTQIFSNNDFKNFPKIKIDERKQKFMEEVLELIELIHNKKACCSIEFDGFSIYNFLKALSTIIYETQLEIRENGIFIITMDPSCVSLVDIHFINDNYMFFQPAKVAFNIINLQNVLKCKKSDKSKTSLLFAKDRLYIAIDSKRFHSNIERELKCIDLPQGSKINLDSLDFKHYQFQFNLTKDRLNYLIDNFGIYEQVISIVCYSNKIVFEEESDSGSNQIIWKNDEKLNIRSISNKHNKNDIDKENIEINVNNKVNETDQDNKNKKNHQNSEKNEIKVQQYIALDFFKILNNMATILNKSDAIEFFIGEKMPLGTEIKINNLGNTVIRFYIAPKILEEEE